MIKLIQYKKMISKTKIITLIIFFSFLITPLTEVRASLSDDANAYEKYPLYSKYEKKQKYDKYKKFLKAKEQSGLDTEAKRVQAKDGYAKYKLYLKDKAKNRAYAVYLSQYNAYKKYKKYSDYKKYKKYKKYNKKEYDKYKKYGSQSYKDGYNRYKVFMADIDNVTTNRGPEIKVGLWSSNTTDLAANPFKITANKAFRVTNCAGTVVAPSIAIGQNVRVSYAGDGILNAYNSDPLILANANVGDKICFDAVDGNNLDMIFDVNRPLLYDGDSGSGYDQYRGKIKIQHSLDPNLPNDGNANCSLYQDATFPAWDPENACRRVWVINELPLELYLWGYGEMSTGGIEHLAKTMMVAARSYARWWVEYATKWDMAGFDLIASPVNQIYNGYDYELTHSFIPDAAQKTNGIIMKYGSDIVLGAYCSNTDGRTKSALEAWGLSNHPYLQSVADPYGAISNPSAGNHMVGLSANGARVLASDHSWQWTRILSYYYSGINIVKEY
ncbi:MAG TPA: hypothetical protein DEA43_00360 [Candidatus Moranbacteria bacterium]|nr:hypothetical protein [Candidatus Moranbacteria bacterium]HBT45324.1 hypothetical protein [Candidatus Moranbacteria bacterium]